MFNLGQAILDSMRQFNNKWEPVFEGPNIEHMTSCSGGCGSNPCQNQCSGSCKNSCTRSCKGNSR